MNINYPNRLIDHDILTKLFSKNSVINDTTLSNRLISYELPNYSKVSKIGKKIEKIKDDAFKQMGPMLLNGFLFVSIILVIYYILQYRYNKKKNSKNK
jgi:hypothetical protein